MKKFLLYIMVVAGMMSLQSCLHDDKELFDESAADRLEHATEETKQILESSTSGWALQYYLGDEYTGGGCTYLVKFKDGKADVALDEVGDPTVISHSSYDVIKDQGPVLTFNTYNELMHYFANPNNDGTTNGGDFEFVVMNVTNDVIDLKGRTTGNKMKLVRLPEGTDWTTYLNSISDFEENMFTSYKLVADGKVEGLVTFDSDSRQFSYLSSDSTVSFTSPYCVTPDGVVMPKALADDVYSYAQKQGEINLTATDAADGKSVYLEPFFTPDYVIRNLGSAMSLNDEALTTTFKLNKADAYTYTTDADWLTVSADKNGITINATANDEGHPRTATVKVANENGEDEFTVTQLEYAKDVAGTYGMLYYDADASLQVTFFDASPTSPDAIDVPITIGNYTLHATLKWNAETGSYDWTSGQYMGKWRSYYMINIFLGEQYWSSVSTNYVYSAPVAYNEEDGTYAYFSEGQVAGEDISCVYLEACTTNPATSSSIAGYVDIMYSPAVVKLDETEGARGAKGRSSKLTNFIQKMQKQAPAALQLNPKFGKKLIK